MNPKTYSIFGAGAAGLYTAWRLLNGKAKTTKGMSKLVNKGDTLELYDWGKYDFSKKNPGTREPGARVCTWHYQDDKKKSYLELGGMRYAEYDETTGAGHLLVTTVLKRLGLDKYTRIFNESNDQLLFLRNRNLFLSDITPGNPAPYNIPGGGASRDYDGFSQVGALAVSPNYPSSRKDWCEFNKTGELIKDLPPSSVFKKGDKVSNIGYWNLMYDVLGPEGYQYTADANGYSSNVINWNSAVAFNANNEFAPGTSYRTITLGYSAMFTALFAEIEKTAKEKGVVLKYHANTRLHSILDKKGVVHFHTATRDDPRRPSAEKTCTAAWLAMPRHSIELVAEATGYQTNDGLDVLNDNAVKLYLEAAIMQPSYKIGLFFDEPWWEKATYAPRLTSLVVTAEVLKTLKTTSHWPEAYLKAMKTAKNKDGTLLVYNIVFDSPDAIIGAVEQCVEAGLDATQLGELLTTTKGLSSIGPSFSDTPIRMAVYFGNNALDQSGKKVYGMLASYDDEYFTTFWRELEEGIDEVWDIPASEDIQPLIGPRKASPDMVKMLRKQLAEMHYGPGSNPDLVPEPLEARYMDWSLPPFNAGYHAWAAHYDICDVMQKIRKPSQLIKGANADIFIVGEAYSNDQAWVEGAFCTSESVLNDFFDLEPIVDNPSYPFICG